MKVLKSRTGKDLMWIYCKSETFLLADAHLDLQKHSIGIYRLDPLYCVS